MYKQILEGVKGIELYPILSMLIFIGFFVVLGIWVFKARKSYIKKMSRMPLEDDVVDDRNENNDENNKDLTK